MKRAARFASFGLIFAVTAVTAASALADSEVRNEVHFVAGSPSHGYGEHEYRAGAELLAAAIEASDLGFRAIVHEGWPEDAGVLNRAAAVVLTMDGSGGHEALGHLAELEAIQARGVGVMALHWAVHVPRGEAGNAFLRMLGGYYESETSTNPKWQAELALDPSHPVSRGVQSVTLYDEWYFNIRFRPEMQGVRRIATAVPSDDDRSRVSAFFPWSKPVAGIAEASGRRETLIWSVDDDGGSGRGLGFAGGHFHWNLHADAFRTLLLNAVVWVAGGEVPEGGVASARPSFEELRANQDEREPLRFDAEAVREQFFAPEVLAGSHVPLDRFYLPEDLSIEVWAESPLLFNPTNIDIDAAGRVWAAEGWNYRSWDGERAAGDRIVVLADSDGDGRADSSHTFVQDPELAAPLGLAVIGNRVLVSMPPHLIEYTDVDGDLRFDPAVDRRRNLLSGFGGRASDHALHSVVVGPDGDWYANFGNDGGSIVDAAGRSFHFAGRDDDHSLPARKSDDGRTYVGGASFRFHPDESGFEVIGHNFRNSYEQAISSYGDIFQNDNDDGDASRTTWLMPYGNAGFASLDGMRSWYLDRRPGQSLRSAHWRQLDPGVMPSGHVYGAGAPTGIVFNESDGLGEGYRGLLISADAALETLLAYRPKPKGAGFELEAFDLLTTNPTRSLGGTDTSRGAVATGIPGYFVRKAGEARALTQRSAWFEAPFRWLGLDRAYTAPEDAGPHRFRPSDIAIGTDGALYVADWLDAFVGGNTMSDLERRGAIYRISRKGAAAAELEAFDLTSMAGAARALRSPAVNVRALGFEALRAAGAEALPTVRELLADEDAFVRARALWLLPHVGGEADLTSRIRDEGAATQERITAFRAQVRSRDTAATDALEHALDFARSGEPALRREAAIAMREVPWADSKAVLLAAAARLDPSDRFELEAFGTGASGVESELFAALLEVNGAAAEALAWSEALAALVWRLHPPEAVAALRTRALSTSLPAGARMQATAALGFVPTLEAALALRDITEAETETETDDVAKSAAWWLDHNADTSATAFGVGHELPPQYKPEIWVDFRAMADADVEQKEAAAASLGSVEDVARTAGDADRGREAFRSGEVPCQACHSVDGTGGTIGPDLTNVGSRLDRERLIARLLHPTSDLMPSAAALGLSAEQVADLVRYLSELQ